MNTTQVLATKSPGGASRAPVTGAFKVDISRGERIGRVSSEWFSRPDDERYLSLSTLYEAVRTRAERATARTVETRHIRVDARVVGVPLIWPVVVEKVRPVGSVPPERA